MKPRPMTKKGHKMKQMLEAYQAMVEGFLDSCLENEHIPGELHKAMQYSLLAGGKRVRPALCLAWAELFSQEPAKVLGFACALELIHTYSLVHDDLPAMDDDDLRRGKPANHVQFGEAMAILAGDGLLTQAFLCMLHTELPPDRVLAAARAVARAAGPAGMVGGQVMDIRLSGQNQATLEKLKAMHSLKTGAMICGSCLSGALLAGAETQDLKQVQVFGQAIGLAFQVADDILDIEGDSRKMGKPTGSDQRQGKLTYPSLLGLEASKSLGQDLVQQAVSAISVYHGPQALFLRELAQYIMQRVH